MRFSSLRLLLGLTVIMLFGGCSSSVAAKRAPVLDDASLREAASSFLTAFDNLDWESFQAKWSAEPTVFFPFDDTPQRVTGRDAVDARFRKFFDAARARSTTGPPYLRLSPVDLRTERHGDSGIVTFMLGGSSGVWSRRTLVFVREAGGWKLAHLHASAAGVAAR